MSSKAGKMEKQVLKTQMPEMKTKSMQFRIDVEIAGEGTKTTYMIVTGIPEDLPEEYENTVVSAAEQQFASVLSQRKFIEFYDEGKSSKDEKPTFINIARKDWLKIKSITKITN